MELGTLLERLKMDHLSAQLDVVCEQAAKKDRDYKFVEYEGADHSERAWRERVGDQLEWLLREPGM